MKIRLNLNFHDSNKEHAINFVVVYVPPPLIPFQINKSYLIRTNILLIKDRVLNLQIEPVKKVKYKYLIRKYMKENWKVKVKDMKIKHIDNIGVDHNYLVVIDKINSRLIKINNRINTCDDTAWHTFYEIFKIENENYMENRVIYNKLSEKEIANSIMVGDNKLQLNKIYEVVAQLFNN